MKTPSPIDEAIFRPNRSLKVQAQRKFAQGCGPASSCGTPLKSPPPDFMQTHQTPRKDVPEVDIDSLPATEDFLDFLCYRETRLYKPKYDVFLKLKHLSSWQPQSEELTKDDSDDTEDEPLIKFKPERKVQEEVPVVSVKPPPPRLVRRERTKTFPLLSSKKKKRKIVEKKPIAQTKSRRSSVSSSEESLSSLKKSLCVEEEEVKPKKRFPMLRPIAVGVPVSPKKQDTAMLSRSSSSSTTDDAVRTLRSRKLTETPSEQKPRPVKRPATLSDSGESDSEAIDDSRLLRRRNVEQSPVISLRSREVVDSKSTPKLAPKPANKEPVKGREKLERRASDEVPLIRLKRLKVDEIQNKVKSPEEKVKNTRAASLNSTPVVEPPKTRRGSIPAVRSQAKTPVKRNETNVKESKVEEPAKKELRTPKKTPNKNNRKNSSYYERLKSDGYINGSKLNIYDDCSNFLPKDILEAPVFKPTDDEFNNPFLYIKKIAPKAEKFGICKIIPPASFKPSCVLNEDMRFVGYKQHVHKLFDRFGPNVKEYSAIRRHLLTQGIDASQIPTIAGLELDLPMLSAAVAANGGLSKVIEEKKWPAVCDFIRAPKWTQDRSARLDELYIKYLLAYDLLTPEERQKFYEDAENAKEKRFQKRMDNEPVEVEDDPLQEKDECTIKGRSLSLKDFKRLSRNASAMFTSESDSCEAVEGRFWRLVETQLQHTCVLIGSVDAGETGCGFPTNKSPLAKHPWNPKVFTNSSESVLRSMSTVIGVTAPILHFGMVFSACCWFRDPHGLPWIEFMHSGSPRVWYGLSVEQESAFRSAVQKLWPGFIQNKRVWLPSDAVMISPRALHENGIQLSRTVQNPGEFIVVFPRAFTNSISTGYSVSESAYFAPVSWLRSAPQVFADARESCEPTMFSLDRLLVSMVQDTRLSAEMLKEIEPLLEQSVQTELAERTALEKLKLKNVGKDDPLAKVRAAPNANAGSQWECDICRVSLFYSRVYRQLDDTSYCLKHAFENLQLRRKEIASFVLVIAFLKDELLDIVDQLEARLSKKAKRA